MVVIQSFLEATGYPGETLFEYSFAAERRRHQPSVQLSLGVSPLNSEHLLDGGAGGVDQAPPRLRWLPFWSATF
jgi:hypothetical protein